MRMLDGRLLMRMGVATMKINTEQMRKMISLTSEPLKSVEIRPSLITLKMAIETSTKSAKARTGELERKFHTFRLRGLNSYFFLSRAESLITHFKYGINHLLNK